MISYLKTKLNGFNCPQKGGNGGGGGGTSVTTQEIPAELKPLASRYAAEAIKLFDTPYSPYNGKRYADLNSIQTEGINSIVDRARSGNQMMSAASQNLQGMMSNQENPYLRGMVNSAMDAAKGKVMSQFGGSNYGTSANQEQLATQMMSAANPLLSSAYEADQGRRLQAIGMAPQINQAGYQDAQQMLNAGQILQDQDQQGLDWLYQQYQDAKGDPYQKLAAAAGAFSTNLGGTSTTTQQQSGGGGGK